MNSVNPIGPVAALAGNTSLCDSPILLAVIQRAVAVNVADQGGQNGNS